MGMSLRAKLASGFGVVLLIFAITGTVAMLALREQRETLGMIGRHELPTINLLHEASLGMQLYRKAEKDILLNLGDVKALKGYLGKLEEIAGELKENLRKLQDALRGNPQAGAKAESLAQESLRAFAAYDEVVRRTSAELAAGSSQFNANQANAGIFNKVGKHTNGVRPPANAGNHRIRQTAFFFTNLYFGLFTNHALEFTYDSRERMRTRRGTQHIVRGVIAARPVAQRFVTGIFQRGGTAVHRDHFRAHQAHDSGGAGARDAGGLGAADRHIAHCRFGRGRQCRLGKNNGQNPGGDHHLWRP